MTVATNAAATGAGWDAVTGELDQWRAQGLTARLWLRDDDAIAATPALERLIALARRWQAPVLLAVIPTAAEPALAQRLVSEPLIEPCQHGYAHVNHAAPHEKRNEFGVGRPQADALSEIARGRELMSGLFGAKAPPIFTPPWNRIAPEVAAALPSLGFHALSAFGAPQAATQTIAQLNCDLDIIDWRNGRGCVPVAALNARLAVSLARARARSGAPVGVLLHHLVHDEAAWDYLAALLACIRAHKAAAWVSATALAPNI